VESEQRVPDRHGVAAHWPNKNSGRENWDLKTKWILNKKNRTLRQKTQKLQKEYTRTWRFHHKTKPENDGH
jgi:hypothetical protein